MKEIFAQISVKSILPFAPMNRATASIMISPTAPQLLPNAVVLEHALQTDRALHLRKIHPRHLAQLRSGAGIRSGHKILNRFNAAFQLAIGIVHFFAALRKARYSSLSAASSFGNEPRVLMILRNDMFSDSIALVV